MSNNLIYSGIGALIGFLFGGWLVGSVCGKEYKKRIESLQNQLERARNEGKAAKEKDIRDREEALSDPDPLKTLKQQAIYNGYVDGEDEDKEDDDDISKPIDLDDPFEDDTIYLIDVKDFQDDLEYRDNETLTYYQTDGVLVDDHNDKVEDELHVVGKEFMDKARDTEEDYLYVSNDIEDKMYEIIVNHTDSFYRDIMGVG